ncbi:hypothetical protein [Longitalea luteola]|uniref:hypothetical protein n=1 Tax=Longitalea luteola TaxID=2812563 RepID=UPI001A979E3C|nr:hypothetical protein [Longitalea luteola]
MNKSYDGDQFAPITNLPELKAVFLHHNGLLTWKVEHEMDGYSPVLFLKEEAWKLVTGSRVFPTFAAQFPDRHQRYPLKRLLTKANPAG